MRKIGLIALFLVFVIVTACKPATGTVTSTTSTVSTTTAKTMECKIASSVFPAPKAESAKVYAPITSSDWTKGPENATLTVIEYSDFT